MNFSFLRDREFFRAMLALAIPVAFQQLITASLNMIDVLMVGQLGETSVAALGLANQIFFLLIQLYGWWAWTHADRVDQGVAVGWLENGARLRWIGGTAAAVIVWGLGMARFTDAAAPFADAAVAGLSVSAQILQSLRKVESWVLWVCVDMLAIGLFAWRGLGVTAALYALFLVLAVLGFAEWRRKARA